MSQETLQSDVTAILQSKTLTALFQPIIDINRSIVYGHEALIRGPVGTKLHAPIDLFEASHLVGLTPEMEYLSRDIALGEYAKSKNLNKLFVNISPECLQLTDSQYAFSLSQLERIGLRPRDIVIEITEGTSIKDYSVLKSAVSRYREMGFSIALDDLGEGFSSLRLWSEISPDFVKIDKHFISNIHNDLVKLEFVRAIQKIATEAGGLTIAEGVETRDELAVIKDLKINFAQGYLFGRPLPQFQKSLADDIKSLLNKNSISVFPDSANIAKQSTVANLVSYQLAITAEQTNEEVFAMFQAEPQLYSIPVVAEKMPLPVVASVLFTVRIFEAALVRLPPFCMVTLSTV